MPIDQAARRRRMVAEQLRARGIRDERVLAAMAAVPRERFVRAGLAGVAYADGALPIEAGQTISQPYIVALMAEALALTGVERVLDVGSGSGYAAAVLAHLAAEVHAVERQPALALEARRRLGALGYRNVSVYLADGSLGLPDHAPFDAVQVAAQCARVPPALLEQLAPGGRLVLPVGPDWAQELQCIHKHHDGTVSTVDLCPVRFVPLLGAPPRDRGRRRP